MGTKGRYSTGSDSKTEEGVNPKTMHPFDNRVVENPTTNFDTLIHLLKAVFGTGILSMPYAFRQSGLLVGILATIIVGVISTHCAYILIKCAHILYYKVGKSTMSFPQVAEQSLLTGPKPLQKYSKLGRIIVEGTLFVAYSGTCSVFVVVAATNYRAVVNWYFNNELVTDKADITGGFSVRYMILCLLIPLVVLSWIPDLKRLVPLSMIANFSMIISVIIIFVWIFKEGSFDSSKFVYFPSTFQEFVDNFPKCFSIVIFAMESIGVIMPIENKMKTPKKFIGTFGVLNLGMGGIAMMYVIIGAVGYMKYPDSDKDMLTLEIPQQQIVSHVIQILVGTSVVCTCRLLFSVCLEIGENWVKNFDVKVTPKISYSLRTALMTFCVMLAFALPRISPFMTFIGAFCFSIQGFILPVMIETITVWNVGFGFCKWIAIKNTFIVIIALLAIYYGVLEALPDMKKVLFNEI